jgi:hypothetical protein
MRLTPLSRTMLGLILLLDASAAAWRQILSFRDGILTGQLTALVGARTERSNFAKLAPEALFIELCPMRPILRDCHYTTNIS